ncbi:MAG: TetR/AcrR family transcriptional regulator [Kineosporiaceae bacterium]|nr:TetR/AcrR family transcriptional regulator [Aeromicrobium sp.]
MSRAERQALTRESLIATARELFLADGYAATSLGRVALEAGFSKGAVYSNFAGKEELCMAVLDSLHEEQIEGVLLAFSKDTDLDGRIDAFVEWARKGLGRPRWTALEVEFAGIARQSPYVALELIKRHREITDALTELIAGVVNQENLDIMLTPRQAATALLSLGIGLGAMRSLDSSIDVDIFGGIIRALLAPSR